MKTVKSLNFLQNPFDPCHFALSHPCGKLSKILSIHVDDELASGDADFEEQIKIAASQKRYPCGSKIHRVHLHRGVDLKQYPDKGIMLSRSARPIEPSETSRSGLSGDRARTASPASADRIFAICIRTVHTRPDLACRVSFLQSAINWATVQTFIDGNRVLYEAKKHHDLGVHIKPIAPQDARVLAFSDGLTLTPESSLLQPTKTYSTTTQHPSAHLAGEGRRFNHQHCKSFQKASRPPRCPTLRRPTASRYMT